MKYLIGAIALLIAAPAAAQTTPHAEHDGHGSAQHQHGGQQPAQHQGHGDGCCADRNNNGTMDCCERPGHDAQNCCCEHEAGEGRQQGEHQDH